MNGASKSGVANTGAVVIEGVPVLRDTVPALRLPLIISISAADRAIFVPVRTTKTRYGLRKATITYKCYPK